MLLYIEATPGFGLPDSLTPQEVYCLVLIGTAVVLLEHANKWASDLQQLQIHEAKKLYGDGPRLWEWEGPWAWYIGKFGIIFLTVVIVTVFFALIFGPF
jgi:hypothetical protein